MAEPKKINWQNLLTVGSVTILVGTELIGVTWAAGWAIGGIFELPPLFAYIFEITGALLGLVGLYYFVRSALKAEPIRQ